MRHLLPLLAALLLLAGCRSVGPVTKSSAAPPAPGDILDVDTGRDVSFDGLMRSVRGDRVVYVGEQHDNDEQHAFQARVVRALFEQDPNLVIGMEMFQRPWQGALDRFVAGEIDEAAMLRETEYFKRWGWDYRYYRPILLFARDHGIPIVALNAPAEVNRKVAREGLDALTPEERAQIATDIDLDIEAHRAYVKAVFDAHPMPPWLHFENFYASQCVWEDTMAESVAKGLESHPGSRMVVIVGGGHVQRGFGIPIRAAKRGAKPYAILLGEVARPGFDSAALAEMQGEHAADFLYFTHASPGVPPTPRLGVTLEEKGGEGVAVTDVVKGSLAGLAGVKKDDVIVGLNGSPVTDLQSLKATLTFMDGRTGTITVMRDGERRELVFDRAWTAAP